MSFEEFLHMGGYAPYVWSSYALAAVVLFFNLWLPARRFSIVRMRIRRRLARKERLS